ncbi:MAG: hypothetical protein CSA24_00050 [Deltaproteobacteria bacterium]|nr:MAG: hypothetical protein CSA24_00050 [Deltaproteobacteria bacterium]
MQIIGSTTTYHGTEHRYLVGYEVRVIAVIKGAAGPDYDPDADGATTASERSEETGREHRRCESEGRHSKGGRNLTDDEDIARAGGVTADDRALVQPWIEKEGRFSFASSDPRAIDLACFAHLAC